MIDLINLICMIVIYITIFYLFYYGKTCNNLILVCSSILLIAHVYKDVTKMKVWARWTDYVALFISSTLMYQGYEDNIIVFIIGIIMSLGHVRQLVFNDNKYYTP